MVDIKVSDYSGFKHLKYDISEPDIQTVNQTR